MDGRQCTPLLVLFERKLFSCVKPVKLFARRTGLAAFLDSLAARRITFHYAIAPNWRCVARIDLIETVGFWTDTVQCLLFILTDLED